LVVVWLFLLGFFSGMIFSFRLLLHGLLESRLDARLRHEA